LLELYRPIAGPKVVHGSEIVPVVGIGASAGGVEALETLFEGLHSGMAWSPTFQPTSGTQAAQVTQLQQILRNDRGVNPDQAAGDERR
jgi:hypothetical protein